MVSPDAASEIACPMVAQAVAFVLQLLPSSPLTPSTYHVLLARAAGARARNSASSSRALNPILSFITHLHCRSWLRNQSQGRAATGSQEQASHTFAGSLRRTGTIVKRGGVLPGRPSS